MAYYSSCHFAPTDPNNQQPAGPPVIKKTRCTLGGKTRRTMTDMAICRVMTRMSSISSGLYIEADVAEQWKHGGSTQCPCNSPHITPSVGMEMTIEDRERFLPSVGTEIPEDCLTGLKHLCVHLNPK